MTAKQWVFENADRDFQRGPLVSSTFWGRASDADTFDAKAMRGQPSIEMDISGVKFARVEYAFYVSRADPDGKIRGPQVLPYAPHDPLQMRLGR